MIALYRPGDSLVHRLPAGVKLAGLVAFALAASLLPRTLWIAGSAFVLVFALFVAGGLGAGLWLRQLWATKWIVLVLGATQTIFLGWEPAVANTARVVSIVLFAALVTFTTPASETVEVLQRVLGPLRRLGVDPWRIAFTVQLAIAVLPVIQGFAARIREAQRARGVRLGARSIVTLLVMSLRHADDMADALTARGIA
ncbi:energy-coupling factor transporter transmembrane component T family protein [Microbacterium sp. gxy059]|uniref:energy-coupling factor transporter transmembrane component T family protein n=1 Tax=Microbacterium sp. gxy059 TaxID=2957199 RepID=UPI003D96809D